ncbi:MAG: hypothetical protein M5U01_32250 [Ardenticatenaceae bacterium]|nr:hypothetical protein [Ardenticatenaceae bacterium]HBY92613.1 hypothetical protein [Chloroflexota bacterium]
MDRENHAMVETPIACTLPASEQGNRSEAVAGLLRSAQRVDELADGYAFQYPGSEEWATQLLAFIVSERRCCPFFVFELAFETNHGPLWLHLRGEAGVKEFVRDQLIRRREVLGVENRPCSCCA